LLSERHFQHGPVPLLVVEPIDGGGSRCGVVVGDGAVTFKFTSVLVRVQIDLFLLCFLVQLDNADPTKVFCDLILCGARIYSRDIYRVGGLRWWWSSSVRTCTTSTASSSTSKSSVFLSASVILRLIISLLVDLLRYGWNGSSGTSYILLRFSGLKRQGEPHLTILKVAGVLCHHGEILW